MESMVIANGSTAGEEDFPRQPDNAEAGADNDTNGATTAVEVERIRQDSDEGGSVSEASDDDENFKTSSPTQRRMTEPPPRPKRNRRPPNS